VLQVITGLRPGGAELLLLNVAPRLVNMGWEVDVVCLREGQLAADFEKLGIHAICLDVSKGDWRAPWRLRKAIRSFKPHIIHGHLFESEVMTCLGTLDRLDIPLVFTRHGLDVFRRSFFYRLVNAVVTRRSRYVIAISDPIGKMCLNEKMPADKILRVWNGVDTARFSMLKESERLAVRARYNLDRCLVVGSVGRLSEEKGHYYLLEAWKKVMEVFPDARLLLIGDGPLRGRLESLSQKWGIDSRVRFLGIHIDDLPELLNCLDVFVLPSVSEGLGIALIEAMAVGCPVIASRVGGIPDLVSPEYGILVEPGDSVSLAESIIELLRDLPRRQRMCSAARSRVESDFNIDDMVKRLDSIYKSAISGETLPADIRFSIEKINRSFNMTKNL